MFFRRLDFYDDAMISKKPIPLAGNHIHQAKKLSQLWAGLFPVDAVVFVAMLLNDEAHFAQ